METLKLPLKYENRRYTFDGKESGFQLIFRYEPKTGIIYVGNRETIKFNGNNIEFNHDNFRAGFNNLIDSLNMMRVLTEMVKIARSVKNC